MTRKKDRVGMLRPRLQFALWCLFGLSTACLATACAKTSASVMPSVHLDSYKTFYVAGHEGDKANVAGMIAVELKRRGLRAAAGAGRATLADEEVVVTYEDHWTWDITMYMLSLKVDLRDAKTDELLASGESYRPSAQRRSPEEMVQEVFTELFRVQ